MATIDSRVAAIIVVDLSFVEDFGDHASIPEQGVLAACPGPVMWFDGALRCRGPHPWPASPVLRLSSGCAGRAGFRVDVTLYLLLLARGDIDQDQGPPRAAATERQSGCIRIKRAWCRDTPQTRVNSEALHGRPDAPQRQYPPRYRGRAGRTGCMRLPGRRDSVDVASRRAEPQWVELTTPARSLGTAGGGWHYGTPAGRRASRRLISAAIFGRTSLSSLLIVSMVSCP